MNRIFASLVFLLFTGFALQGQTKWFVMPGAPVTGTGNSWADPIEFQTAIANALAGDSIFAAQGTYQPASGISFYMKEGEKVYGGFAGTETSLVQRDLSAGHISTLKGNNTRVVFNYNNGLSAAALLDGFTITNGFAPYGAGMTNVSASPTISNCIFSTNDGGGLYNGFSSATVIKCIFTGNTGTPSSNGGGIGNASSPGVSIINCIFSGNTGQLGGGVYVNDIAPTSVSMVNCTFFGNTALSSGGAGAVYGPSRSSIKIQNCIIRGNSSALKISVTVIPSVITNNIIQNGYSGNSSADPLFVNSANPAGPDNIWGTADDGLRLQSGSPASNTGTADISGLNLPNTDIAGALRVQGNKIDIGAYESSFTCSGIPVLYVDSSITASGDGSSWTTAFKTVDEALLAASQCTSAGSILVAKGTYQPGGSGFSLLRDVKIYGGFPSGGGGFAQRNTVTNRSTLMGNGSNVLYNESIDASALLDGFTITGGSAASGAGMYNIYSSPIINNCVFSGNAASSNGGAGGAIYNRDASSPLISNCLFFGNSASTTGTGGGGAIYNSNAAPAMVNCIFTNNTASYGGAIYNNTSTNSVIRNAVFSNNISSRDAGAIANYGNALTLTNVTFVNNKAGGGGGAIDNYGPTLTISNAIFWGNTATDANKDIWFETGTLNINYSFTQISFAGTGNIPGSSSPFLNDASPAGADGIWGTMDDGLTLPTGSPCIDAGTPDISGLGLGATDILGNARVFGSAIDLGAYEFNNSPLPIILLGFTGSLDGGIANLQWQTGVESNFNRFGVEKSTDGSTFRPQGEVTPKGSNSIYAYSIAQQEPTAFYRLKLVDNDGSAKSSRILKLSQSQSAGKDIILLYPNPATNQISIKVPEAGIISIYAADGKMVKTQAISAGVTIVDISGLGNGVYFSVINGTKVTFIKK